MISRPNVQRRLIFSTGIDRPILPLQRFFELIKDDNGVCICHVEETKYLHSKLAGRAEPPSFYPSGFRSLEPVAVDTVDLSPLPGILKQDEELSRLLDRELGAPRVAVSLPPVSYV